MAEGEVLQLVVFHLPVWNGVFGDRPKGAFGGGVLRKLERSDVPVHEVRHVSGAARRVWRDRFDGGQVGLGVVEADDQAGGNVVCVAGVFRIVHPGAGVPVDARSAEAVHAQYAKEPFIIAFTTASSESALPKALENMQKFGVPKHIVSFVLPTGYSFNLDGTTLYLSLAAVFCAQVVNHPIPLGHADCDAVDIDADQQGRGRRAARVTGGIVGNDRHIRHSTGRHRSDSRGGRVYGYGAHVGECAGKLPGVGGSGALGRRALSD